MVAASLCLDNLLCADTDASGSLDMEELWEYLQANNTDISREAAEEKFRTLDINGDGKVSIKEFKKYLEIPDPIALPKDPNEEMLEEAHMQAEAVFDQIDTNGSGTLDFDEVLQNIRSSGVDVSEEKARHIFDDLDINKDGKVTLLEFKLKMGLDPTEEEQVEEMQQGAEENFDKIDADGDGHLSLEEIMTNVRRDVPEISEEEVCANESFVYGVVISEEYAGLRCE